MAFFIPGPSLAAEKQGLGLKFSIENENFKPRMKISSENENFVHGGMFFFFFSRVRARMNFFKPFSIAPRCGSSPKCRLEGPALHPPFALPPPAWAAPLPGALQKEAKGGGGEGEGEGGEGRGLA